MKQLALWATMTLASITMYGQSTRTSTDYIAGKQPVESLTMKIQKAGHSKIQSGQHATGSLWHAPGWGGKTSLSQATDVSYSTEVISSKPQGEEKVYARSGEDYYEFYGSIYTGMQNGYLMRIVYAPDGKTIYMKNPLAELAMDSWVKGTVENGKITMPLYQCIYYDAVSDNGFITAKLDYDPATQEFVPDFTAKSVTFTINEATGAISLDDIIEADKSLYGAIRTNGFEWFGYGDFASVYTPFNEQITTIPQNLTQEIWSFTYDNEGTDGYDMVEVAIDGDKMYIDNLPMMPKNAAITGNINATKSEVEFTTDQFLGIQQDFDAIAYFGGTNYSKTRHEGSYGIVYYEYDYTYAPTLRFKYNAETKTLTIPSDMALLINCGKLNEAIHFILPCAEARIHYYEEKATQPATPAFTNYTDYTTDYGSIKLEFDIPFVDTDSNFINPEKLSYQIFTKRNGKEKVYVFDYNQYTSLEETLNEIPYNFSDNYDIHEAGALVYLYAETNFDDVAIQTINRSCGQEVRSNKVWYKGGIDTGIGVTTVTNNEVLQTIYHRIDGTRITKPEKGINLVTFVYKNGSKVTRKVAVP